MRLIDFIEALFLISISGTLLGRLWQVSVSPQILGPTQSAQWWYLAACLLGIAVVGWLGSKRAVPTKMLAWSLAGGMAAVLLIFPVVSVLNKPLHAYGVGKFAAQFLAPVLVFMVAMSYSRLAILRVGLIATTLCFALHGVLDLGIPATPAEYVRTSQLILGCEEPAVRRFLMVVGIADIIVAVLIWWRPTQIPALALAACWGACTILARIVAYGHLDLSVAYREPWTYETLVRLPHILVPLATCLLAWQMRREPGSDHKPVQMPRTPPPDAINHVGS